MSTPSFTVVINTLDRAPLLDTALAALRHQRHDRFEVVVVNGPSGDDTEAVLDRHPGVRRFRCPLANLSMSRNIGIAAARGEIVAFLDDDAVPEPTWLHRLEGGYDAQDVGAVGGYIRDHTGVAYQRRVTVCDRFGDSEGFDTPEEARRVLGADGWRYFSPTGANSSFRRAALLGIGGFDETFAYFLDETDVHLRLHDAGWRIKFAPGAEVLHKYASNAQRDDRRVPRSLLQPVVSKAYFALRHARPSRSLHEVLSHLADHGATLRWHNANLLRLGLIDARHRARLDREVEEGLRSGVRLGLGASRLPPFAGGSAQARPAATFKPITMCRPRTERLRLAFVSRQYPPGVVGGIAVWTETAARALAERGHEVSVITAAADRPSVDFENGVWVHRVVDIPASDRKTPPLPDLPQALKDHAYAVHDEAMRIRRERGLDLVSWPIWDLEGLAVQTAGVLATVASLHTSFALALPFKPHWQADARYRRAHVDKVIAAETAALRTAPVLLANSAQVVRDLAAANAVVLDPARVRIAPHGLRDVAGASPPPAKERLEVEILFVGRMEVRKGVDVLLDAVAALFPSLPQARLRLIGESGDAAQNVSAFIARSGGEEWLRRVIFEGPVDEKRLQQAYGACDIFVAPSRYESFGLVFVEAMRRAKPCVGTAAGGVAEVVADGLSGLLAAPGDVAGLAAALRTLIVDPGLRRRMGEAGRARYLERFTAEGMALTLEAVYRDALAAAWITPEARATTHGK